MIVIDSSSLILLAKIGVLDIVIKNLKKKLVLTNQIYIETTQKESFDAKIIKKRVEEKSIEKKEIKNSILCSKIQNDFNLGKGESEAIVLCLENKVGLITGDKKAMNSCKILKINFTTVSNLLMSIYQKGSITKIEAEIYVKKLEKFGRYSNAIIQKIKEELK